MSSFSKRWSISTGTCYKGWLVVQGFRDSLMAIAAPVCSPGCRSWPPPNRLLRETSEWAAVRTAAAAAAVAAAVVAVAVMRAEELRRRLAEELRMVQRTVALAPASPPIARTGPGKLKAGLPGSTDRGNRRNENTLPVTKRQEDTVGKRNL